ncbi:protein FRA10AC1 [Musca vetustissima]|uniref:protein FRA10AC1 n=1 Tax=Musca vetustissima TaxID=27455 RepID=UPI002AB7C590|nr:protein FRA10AC1 [Musca vetustissima]
MEGSMLEEMENMAGDGKYGRLCFFAPEVPNAGVGKKVKSKRKVMSTMEGKAGTTGNDWKRFKPGSPIISGAEAVGKIVSGNVLQTGSEVDVHVHSRPRNRRRLASGGGGEGCISKMKEVAERVGDTPPVVENADTPPLDSLEVDFTYIYISTIKMFPISLKTLSDQERHNYILQTFILNNKSFSEQRKHKRDIDVIREHHRFLWHEEAVNDSWEVRLAKRYYDKLFKEYCIADLTRYKENKIALRWRTEAEVVAGIGQFQCGSRKCLEKDNLRSWEVNFAYKEQGEIKNALIKLRLCPGHSEQLNYTSKKREVKRLKHVERQKAKEEKRNQKKSSKPDKNHTIANEDQQDLSNDVNKDCDVMSTCPVVESNEQEEEVVEESDEIWNRNTINDVDPVSRESEFERYLEDLLL